MEKNELRPKIAILYKTASPMKKLDWSNKASRPDIKSMIMLKETKMVFLFKTKLAISRLAHQLHEINNPHS
jgi:hypothetical protein